MQKSDGMNYAPKGIPKPVCGKGEFVFAAIALDHGHIYGICNGLTEAGATLKYVYDPDPEKVANFLKTYPNVKAAASEEEIFNDPEVKLIAGAAVPSERCALGLRAMEHGKDYFTDKSPFTTLEQLEAAKKKGGRNRFEILCLLQRKITCRRGSVCRRSDKSGSNRKSTSGNRFRTAQT